MRTPELLAPAGTLNHLRYAFAFGADAVYAGMPRYSLRVRNNDFSKLATLQEGIETAHKLKRKFFLACNVIPHNSKVKTFVEDLTPVIALQPDALIMADPGLIMIVREHWPDMPIHLSVQANTMNYASVRFWKQLGVQRIILSRELSLDQIAEIRQECPDMELEVFVHGALCIAYSGRCLLSGYFNHRDANQGTCTNACRWEYKVHSSTTETNVKTNSVEVALPIAKPKVASEEDLSPHYREYFLEEPNKRQGELMPIEEDENGTYIMNSKDLRAIEHVHRLTQIGIDSLKIEGRTKSHYYVARTSQAYRRAIDDAAAGRPFDESLIGELANLANRGYTDGFYQRHHAQDYQSYEASQSHNSQQQFVGELMQYNPTTGMADIDVKNCFAVGDTLEWISPQGNYTFTLDKLEDSTGIPIQRAPGGGHKVRVPLKQATERFGLLAKYI